MFRSSKVAPADYRFLSQKQRGQLGLTQPHLQSSSTENSSEEKAQETEESEDPDPIGTGSQNSDLGNPILEKSDPSKPPVTSTWGMFTSWFGW